MRPEVVLAYVVGIALPIVETARRGFDHWSVNATTMIEDYAIGTFLAISAWRARVGSEGANTLLLAAWSSATTMLTLSSVGQIETAWRGSLEPDHAIVLILKLGGTVIGWYSLVRTYRIVVRS